ncbi:acetate--CoA ligase family protein [Candidatus Bipolaricaulota bacterium]|nr:acetate--CoA ligase family protein [Candidatus Bipolaricaulota bacterium]
MRRAPHDPADTRSFLLEAEAVRLISSYGIPYPDHRFASSAEEAAIAADSIGYPVVLKAVAAELIHKSDAGGVIMNLNDPETVRIAFDRMQAEIGTQFPDSTVAGAMICRQKSEGIDVIVGGFHDIAFGPTAMFGLGGIFTDVLDDVAFRIAPIDGREAHQLVREIRSWQLLDGARGRPPCEIEGLVTLIIAVSQLMIEHPEIESLDLNPVRVLPDRLLALDARVKRQNPS